MNELIGGSVAGVSQIIIGYPLDTIKVNYIKNNNTNIMTCIKSIKGFKGYYRGVLSPSYGAVITNAQTFYFYGALLPYFGTIISGGITGALLSICETPTELIKCRMQVSNQGYSKCIQNIYNSMGIKGFYHGFYLTIARNSIGVAGMFWGYETVKKILPQYQYLSSFLGGALGGLLCWVPIYPIDCLKTHVQTSLIKDHNCRYFYKNIKFKHLWKGFLPCIVRAIIVNPFIFLAYDICMCNLKD